MAGGWREEMGRERRREGEGADWWAVGPRVGMGVGWKEDILGTKDEREYCASKSKLRQWRPPPPPL
uniref:Uncharacterized protein n=1 Tax=Oryza punctata TaxID=4537 RepID=A0A0E0MNS1_ORYPU